MSKLCAMPGCEQAIARALLMCPRHWRQVPFELQEAVRRTWQRVIDHQAGESIDEFRQHMAAYRTAREAAVRSVEGVPA